VAKSVRKGRTSPVSGDSAQRLEQVFAAILAQIRQDPAFAQRVRSALEGAASAAPTASEPAPSHGPPPVGTRLPAPPPAPPKRQKALIDPFALYDTGWDAMLREHLERLDVEQLRDVIHQYRLDPGGRTASLSDTAELRAWIIRKVENFGLS
jgi:hypothetical protein